MIKKLKVLAVLVCLSLTLGLMSNTYSRYVADAASNLKIQFAKWEVKINTIDITNSTSSTIDITPTMKENVNVASNTIAPSSKGYFDIALDPTDTDVSFNYSIALSLLNENIPDLMISEYAILDSTFDGNDDAVVKTAITNNTISGTLNYNDTNVGTVTEEKYSYNAFTIRIYFEWIEGTNELMNDEADTQIGSDAAINNTELQVQATMHFEQKLS